MFENIGGKIKGVCKACCYIGMGSCLLMGLILLLNGTAASMAAGVFIAALGSLLFWLSSLALYGFGQLVENSDILVKRLSSVGSDILKGTAAPKPSEPQRPKAKEPIPPNAVIFPTRVETEIKCPKCGFEQIGYWDACLSCDAPFLYEDELE